MEIFRTLWSGVRFFWSYYTFSLSLSLLLPLSLFLVLLHVSSPSPVSSYPPFFGGLCVIVFFRVRGKINGSTKASTKRISIRNEEIRHPKNNYNIVLSYILYKKKKKTTKTKKDKVKERKERKRKERKRKEKAKKGKRSRPASLTVIATNLP